MTQIYIGLPSDYMHYRKWLNDDVQKHLEIELDIRTVIFVFNASAGVYDGDVYRCYFKDDQSLTHFLLKNKIDRVKEELVDEYLRKKR